MRRTLLEIPIPFFDLTVPVYSYGFMMMMGFIFGVLVAQRKVDYEGIDPHEMTVIWIYGILGGLVGARVFHVMHHIAEYSRHPLGMFMVQKGGLSFYGGVIGGVIVAGIFCRRRGLSPLKCLDIGVVGIALGLALARIGCFLHGCCYGRRVADDFIFRVYFPKITDASGNVSGSHVFLHHLKQGWVGFADSMALPVHPTQLYSALGAFALFLVLSNVYKYKKRDGEVFLLFVILYAPMRFYWEMLRGDSAPVLFGLTVSQLVGIPAFLLALFMFIRGRRRLESA
ncbi:MAG: prolipoprotein diacylglyceryl transferase [Candidatus Brocadiales bacterium]